tara:strand:- start:434 stop:1723 length:1290 start_codon:yes stop_codon:yes gene_type:complete
MDELYSSTRANPNKQIKDVFIWGPDPHPPLHYLILWSVYKLFGFSEIAGRLISVIAGTLIIPAIFYLAKQLFSERTAFFAAFFASINPFLIYYSTEVRSYELLCLFSIFSTYFFIRLNNYEFKRLFFVVVYFCINLVLINLHFFGVLTILGQFIFLILVKNRKISSLVRFTVINIVAFSSYFFLINLILSILASGPSWIQQVNFNTYIFETFNSFIFNQYILDHNAKTAVGTFLVAFFVSGIMLAGKRDKKEECILIICMIFSIIIIPIFLGLMLHPLFTPRNAIGALPFLLLAYAFLFDELTKKVSRRIVLTSLALVSVVIFVNYKEVPKQEWRESLKYASSLSDQIYVPHWPRQWETYASWLNIKDVNINDLKLLNKTNHNIDKKVVVVWAQLKPEEFERLSEIIKDLELVSKKNFNGSGIYIYTFK